MANIKSAKKRVLVNEKKAARNKAVRSRTRTYVKKVQTAIQKGDKEAAKKSLNEAIGQINRAASKGVYHKNKAARQVSRLTKAVNEMN